jgi:predicted acylesterase/phospholipase RssA
MENEGDKGGIAEADDGSRNIDIHPRDRLPRGAARRLEESQNRMNEPKPIRRGLVLEGGGGKGAWQFGVLRAFVDNNIQFDVVSGTSVGALNGAIWCSGRMDIGIEMWSSMSLRRIFALRLWLIPFVILGFGSQIFYTFYEGYAPRDSESERRTYTICALMMAMTPIIGIWVWLLLPQFPSDALFDSMRANLATFVVMSFILVLIFVKSSPPQLPAMFWLLGVDAWGRETLFVHGYRQPLNWIGAIPVLLLASAWLLRITNASIFSAAPLEKEIRLLLSAPLRVPLFATVGSESGEYFDPDNLDYQPIRLFSRNPTYLPVGFNALIPSYLRVDQLGSPDALNALLASSALPLGVVSGRKSDTGIRLMDGGVADNVPWQPLISDFPCDEIVIVHCNPAAEWSDVVAQKAWQKAERMKRVLALKFKASSSMSYNPVIDDPPRHVPFKESLRWPTKIMTIAPDQLLGSFFTGTLNFSRQTCRKRMQDGYAAGIRFIESTLGKQTQAG